MVWAVCGVSSRVHVVLALLLRTLQAVVRQEECAEVWDEAEEKEQGAAIMKLTRVHSKCP